MSLVIAMVPPTMVDFIWAKCLPHFEEVAKKAPEDIGIDTIHDRILEGHTLLVAILDGDEVVAINTMDVQTLDSGNKVLYIPITGGSRMDEWMERFLDIAHGVAAVHDCIELRGLAVRKGWLRKLSDYGWEEHFVTIKCKVKG
jgi:hypothetical protein